MSKARPECVDCSKLPTRGGDLPLQPDERASDYRPVRPRPIATWLGPRTPLCRTHQLARRRTMSARRAEQFRATVHQMSPATFAALRAAQGDRCPCGNRLAHLDHDHRKARVEGHDHDPDTESCPQCWRGLLCRKCNSDLLGPPPRGLGYSLSQLTALVAYLNDPPARRLVHGYQPHKGTA